MQSGSQLTSTSLPPVAPTQPAAAAMATQAELEAAIAALPAKKRRLREAFDRLVACSPVPVPFRWEDLDAHLAAVAAHFRHFEHNSPHASDAAAEPAAETSTTRDPVEHLEGDEVEEHRKRRGERGAWEERQGSNAEEGEEVGNASLDQEGEEEEGEVREASGARPDRGSGGDEAGNAEAQVAVEAASPEQDEGAEEGAIVASPLQGDVDVVMMEAVEEEDEAAHASAGRDGVEDDGTEEGELPRATAIGGGGETALVRAVAEGPSAPVEVGEEKDEAPHASAGQAGVEDDETEGELWRAPRATAIGGGGETAPTRPVAVAADPSTLAGLLCLSGSSSLLARREFLPALLGAADPHAFLVRAVGEFLASSARKTNRFWENCVALIECAPRLAAPSPDALEQAEGVAKDWKELWSCGGMSRLAGWALLTFLASYNIVLEFDADEIGRLFGNSAPQMKDNCVELCERLGLVDKIMGMVP
nr:unnamed protein product [Digitaria exilis]